MRLGTPHRKPAPEQYLHRVHSRALDEFFARRRQEWELRAGSV